MLFPRETQLSNSDLRSPLSPTPLRSEKSLRVAMLLTDGYGGFGGISKFNRDLLTAFDACPIVERVYALPRLIPEAIIERVAEAVVYDRSAARGKAGFISRVIARAGFGSGLDLVVCGHLHLLPPAWLLARLRGARLALVIHGIEAWEPCGHVLANRMAPAVDAVLAVSRYSAKRFASWSRMGQAHLAVLPNCIDLKTFQPQPRDLSLLARYKLGTGKVLLTVGRLASEERYKGFDQVIELMPRLLERYAGLQYLIVGDGADRPRLAAKAKAIGVSDNVVFAGRIPESEKVAHYNLADAYVMPSRGEGFGIVLIEAAACGIPVVGSSIDGSGEALLEGRLGRLIDPRDPAELIDAIVTALEVGERGMRNPLIKTFGVGAFQRRVDAWCREQLAAHCEE
jgi:phosphatidyl-myo-inositol dimannoside synthase